MANLVLDMPCVKAAVPRRDVFLNPNDQMRRNLYLNTLLKIYQTLLLRHRQLGLCINISRQSKTALQFLKHLGDTVRKSKNIRTLSLTLRRCVLKSIIQDSFIIFTTQSNLHFCLCMDLYLSFYIYQFDQMRFWKTHCTNRKLL
ncbi:unnamed protein product [Callosobruchus maculatus]|uniref:Uncharacterized protein n=1 Tax=Callosobruchus maculatus TaxID=64391 RepID=A0A653D9Y6_CALMS|nr:unnamed protein product [Callosobruchus maculatus]